MSATSWPHGKACSFEFLVTHPASAMQLAGEQRRNLGQHAAERVREGEVLAALQVERAISTGSAGRSKADLVPVRYLVTLLGVGDQNALRAGSP